MPLKNKKQILSWCLFDFANSSYSAVISAVIFPVYYANRIVGNETGLGDLWWGRAISLSMAAVVLTSPFLGGIADFGGIRKRLLFIYTLLCVSAVASFSLIQKGMVIEGFILAVLANIGMEGGLVFYNSFLPEIAERKYQGRVSAWGFAIGYAGSILALIIALPLIKTGYFNLTWLMVSVFFALFSLPAFLFLPKDRKSGAGIIHSASKGIRYTWSTFKNIWGKKEARKFLISYLFFEDGVNTVIVFSSIFAATTLGFKPQELIMLYLLVQITALTGAFAMARPIDLRGLKSRITVSGDVGCCICIGLLRTDKVRVLDNRMPCRFWPWHCAGSSKGLFHPVYSSGARIRIFRRIFHGGKIIGDIRAPDLRLYILVLRKPAPCNFINFPVLPHRPHMPPICKRRGTEYRHKKINSPKNSC